MNRLDVYLNALPVGRLERKGSDTWTFQFFDSYLELEHRPVLSQSFEDDLERAHSATLLLPFAGSWSISVAAIDAMGNVGAFSAAVGTTASQGAQRVLLPIARRP